MHIFDCAKKYVKYFLECKKSATASANKSVNNGYRSPAAIIQENKIQT
jgi:hypothetical protein